MSTDKTSKPADNAPPAAPRADYIIDRPVYHTPGQQPHGIGATIEFEIAQVAHLVEAGFMHMVGADPAPTAIAVGNQQISAPSPAAALSAASLPAAPLNYQAAPNPQSTTTTGA